MSEDLEKRNALLKKLKTMMERGGTKGERDNAEFMLKKLLAKHGMTMEDLEIEVVDVRLLKYKDELHQKFIHQIIGNVMGSIDTWTHKRLKKTIIFESTLVEFIEIEAKVDFFFRDYIRQRQMFYKAYIQKNELFKKSDGPAQEVSQEEYEELIRMMQGIEKKIFRTQVDKKPAQIEHKEDE